MPRAIETRHRLCLVAYHEDPQITWHMRALLVKGSDSQWIAASPDFEPEIMDVAARPVLSVSSGAELPLRERGNVYAFAPFENDEGDELGEAARQYAILVGFLTDGAVASGDAWRISDTAHENFGQEVPTEAVADGAQVVIRGTFGLACVDEVWTSIGKVPRPSWIHGRPSKAQGLDMIVA